MRRIASRKDAQKKEKRNQLILGILLILVMFFGIFGYGLGSSVGNSSSKVEYNGVEFVAENGRWKLPLEELNLYFAYNPEQTENLSLNLNLNKNLDNYYEKKVYVSSNDSRAFYEIYSNLYPYVLNIQEACVEGETCYGEDLPIKNCTNNIIILRKRENNRIYSEENCVFVEYKEEDKLRMCDRFLFRIFGIQ